MVAETHGLPEWVTTALNPGLVIALLVALWRDVSKKLASLQERQNTHDFTLYGEMGQNGMKLRVEGIAGRLDDCESQFLEQSLQIQAYERDLGRLRSKIQAVKAAADGRA